MYTSTDSLGKKKKMKLGKMSLLMTHATGAGIDSEPLPVARVSRVRDTQIHKSYGQANRSIGRLAKLP